jgi:effector-binding domain-containing protein
MAPLEIREQTAKYTLAIRFRAPVSELSSHFGPVYGRIMAYLDQLGAAPAGPVYAAYHNMDMADLDVEAGIEVARPTAGQGEIIACKVPAATVAVHHFHGPYDDLPKGWEALCTWVAAQGYQVAGPAYEWYVDDPAEVPPAELKTDLVMAVRKAAS